MTNSELMSLVDSAPDKTKKFIAELVILTAKLPYGYLEPKIEVHGSQIVKAQYEGWRKLKSHDNNIDTLQLLLNEYKSLVDKKTTNKVISVVNMKDGIIKDIFFRSEIKSIY